MEEKKLGEVLSGYEGLSEEKKVELQKCLEQLQNDNYTLNSFNRKLTEEKRLMVRDALNNLFPKIKGEEIKKSVSRCYQEKYGEKYDDFIFGHVNQFRQYLSSFVSYLDTNRYKYVSLNEIIDTIKPTKSIKKAQRIVKNGEECIEFTFMNGLRTILVGL